MQNLVAVVLESVLHLRREMPISNKLHQNGTTKSSKKRIATSSHDSRKCYQPETWTHKDMSWTSSPSSSVKHLMLGYAWHHVDTNPCLMHPSCWAWKASLRSWAGHVWFQSSNRQPLVRLVSDSSPASLGLPKAETDTNIDLHAMKAHLLHKYLQLTRWRKQCKETMPHN